MRCRDRCLRLAVLPCHKADNKADFRQVAQRQRCSGIRHSRNLPMRSNTCSLPRGKALPFHETCFSSQRMLTASNHGARPHESEGGTRSGRRVAQPTVRPLGSARLRDKSQFQMLADLRGKPAGRNPSLTSLFQMNRSLQQELARTV